MVRFVSLIQMSYKSVFKRNIALIIWKINIPEVPNFSRNICPFSQKAKFILFTVHGLQNKGVSKLCAY